MAHDESATAAARPQRLPRIFPADEIVPALERIIAQLAAARSSILHNVTKENATFDTVLRPLVDVEHETSGDIGVIWMLPYGAPDTATHDAFAKARPSLGKAEASWNSSAEIYELLKAARGKSENLDAASKLLLDKALLEYKLAGCGAITKEEKGEYAKETFELENILAKANRNIAQESGGIWLADQDLEDLPAEELNRIKKQQQPKEAPPDGRMTFVPFSNSGATAGLTFAGDPDVRKRVYLADEKKLQHNVPLLQEIIKRRQSLAQRL